MNRFKHTSQKFDTLQQSHTILAFPIAVVKRYGDDKIGKQAALITYYGFLAVFPLLLAFMTLISFIAVGDPDLQAKISSQVFQFFPSLGNSLRGSVHILKVSGIALVIDLLILIYGARGATVTLQDAFNYVWHADKEHKYNFLFDNLRSIAMIFVIGIGLVIGTGLSYILSQLPHIGVAGTVFITLVNLVVMIGLFLVVFRLGTTSHVSTKRLTLGAMIAGTGMLTVQHFGVIIMSHEIPKLQSTYGAFALTLGMLFWIYLQAQVMMYALVITAVRTQHDWPKKLL